MDTIHCNQVVQNESAIIDGVSFMKALLCQIDWQLTHMLQSIDNTSVIDGRQVTFCWEGKEAVMERKPLSDICKAHIKLAIEPTLAMRRGWLAKKDNGSYELGPSLRYSVP